MNITPELLVELAKEVEAEDPIDWGFLSVSEDDAYRLMALHVLELFAQHDRVAAMATIVKLLVENFALNLKLDIINNGKQ
jgi:hypothetical protein